MKILISDYDYTIKPYDNNPNLVEKNIFKNNIESINKFINNGNIFAIATGRNTSSILEETNKHNINYDYILSYNGRVILDKNNKVIYSNCLDNNILKDIENSNMVTDSIKFNEFEAVENPDKLIYLKVKVNILKNIKELMEQLKSKYPDIRINYNYLFKTLIIRNDFDKKMGIDELLRIEALEHFKKDIYTIGDEINDYEMLESYNGTRMLFSNPKLMLATNKTTLTVKSLIKRLEKNI